MTNTRITNLRKLLATVHSAAEAASDIDECIANAEAHATILESHLCKIINHLIKFKVCEESLLGAGRSCIGTCMNCAWPLYQQPNANLMHFEISYQLGNKCYLPKLGNGGHS